MSGRRDRPPSGRHNANAPRSQDRDRDRDRGIRSAASPLSHDSPSGRPQSARVRNPSPRDHEPKRMNRPVSATASARVHSLSSPKQDTHLMNQTSSDRVFERSPLSTNRDTVGGPLLTTHHALHCRRNLWFNGSVIRLRLRSEPLSLRRRDCWASITPSPDQRTLWWVSLPPLPLSFLSEISSSLFSAGSGGQQSSPQQDSKRIDEKAEDLCDPSPEL